VYDRRLRRFTFLDPVGRVTGIQSIEVNNEIVPLVRFTTGEFLAVLETRPFHPLGLQRAPLFLVVVNQVGAVVDTVGRWAGKERYVTEDRMIQVGFAATTLYAGRGSHAVLATTDSLDVTLFEGSAPLSRISGGYSPRVVSSVEKEAWIELYLDRYPEEVRPTQRQRLEQSTVRDSYPAFGALKVDADGTIWIGSYTSLDDLVRRWTVIGADGSPVGALSLPVYRPELLRIRRGAITGWASIEHETTIPSARHELLDVFAGLIAVMRTGELGEEFVEVHEVKNLQGLR